MPTSRASAASMPRAHTRSCAPPRSIRRTLPRAEGGLQWKSSSTHKLGYVPGTVDSSVSLTIEYGQDDVALANFANALGHTDDATALMSRMHGWQKLYDPASGFLWAKNADGTWATPHGDPTVETKDFDEATATQSVWQGLGTTCLV